MKKIVAPVLGLVLLASCGTARKVQQTKQEVRIDSTAIAKEANAKTDKFVDTTRTQHGKITITEIDFYPPMPDNINNVVSVDSGKHDDTSSRAMPNHIRQMRICIMSGTSKVRLSPSNKRSLNPMLKKKAKARNRAKARKPKVPPM